MEVFREVFGDRDDVHLTIKAWGRSDIRVKKNKHIIGLPHTLYKNVTTVYDEVSPDALIQMFHDHDVLIYPSYGEGFGLIPLQAMASGMPTICTEAWAPYGRFLEPDLSLRSEMINSPWPHVHTGKMFEPSRYDLHDAMLAADDDFDTYAGRAYRRSFRIHEDYDWDHLTEQAFEHIVTRFG